MENIKTLISRHTPNIHELIGNDNGYWEKLQVKFEAKIETIEVGQVTENSIPILVGKIEENNDPISLNFVQLIEGTIKELRAKLTPELLGKLEGMIRTLVLEFDKIVMEKPNPAYLNWFSEMVAINFILKSEGYELINFETKLSNGKSMDFEIQDPSGGVVLIDVVNIHISSDRAENQQKLNLFINGKLSQKNAAKTSGLENTQGLFILPILWFDDVIASNIVAYVNSTNFNEGNIMTPCMLGQNIIEESTTFIFGSIESLINDNNDSL